MSTFNGQAETDHLRADIVEIIGLAYACATLGEFYDRLAVLLAAGVADRLRPWPAREEH